MINLKPMFSAISGKTEKLDIDALKRLEQAINISLAKLYAKETTPAPAAPRNSF